MEKVVEVKNLEKVYSNQRGVREINFDIYKGEIFGFLGPNGAGKTTVMKTMVGLCKADKGEVRFFGHPLFTNFKQAMEQVGCMIETADAFEYLSGYDNLKLAARFYSGLPKSRIDEVLELVGLAPYKQEKVAGYSLGMKQRLGLASAILSYPQFVILDEPANGLDVEGMVQIRELITHMAKEMGVTFMVSSHLIHEISLVCNRIAIIQNGRLIQEGRLDELIRDPEQTLEDYFLEQVRSNRRCEGI